MKKYYFILFLVILSTVAVAQKPKKSTMKVVDKTLEFCVEQSKILYSKVEHDKTLFPLTVEDGELKTIGEDWWIGGFFPGTMWYLYEYSKDDKLKAIAEEMTTRISGQQFTTNNHDVGFLINCSAGNGYRLTGKQEYLTALINASKSLATRFNENVSCTRSWDNKTWSFPVIIDNMMNLELFCVASTLTGDNKHYNLAKRHADRTQKYHFREDGSSYHLVDYNPETGAFIKAMTVQGYADETSWSRGQAWGLYGFTMMYRQTGKKEYLNHAIKIANFIVNHPNLPSDKVPYWDFNAPNIPDAKRDASAAAIMASAFIELSCYVDGKLSRNFLNIGEQQVVSLASKYRSAKIGDNHGFILIGSVGFLPQNIEVDVPLSYSDYYFVEALMRLKRLSNGEKVLDLHTSPSEN